MKKSEKRNERGLSESRYATTSRSKEIRNLRHCFLDNSSAQDVSKAIIVRITTTNNIKIRNKTKILSPHSTVQSHFFKPAPTNEYNPNRQGNTHQYFVKIRFIIYSAKFHFMAFRASPQHSSSELGSAFGLRLNSDFMAFRAVP